MVFPVTAEVYTPESENGWTSGLNPELILRNLN